MTGDRPFPESDAPPAESANPISQAGDDAQNPAPEPPTPPAHPAAAPPERPAEELSATPPADAANSENASPVPETAPAEDASSGEPPAAAAHADESPASPSEPAPQPVADTVDTPSAAENGGSPEAASEPPATPEQDAAPEVEPEPARRRVTLNPTGTEDLKAVPSVREASPAPADESAGTAEKPADDHTPAEPPPVEIPPSDTLDSDLEAQIEAAMSGIETPPPVAASEEMAGGGLSEETYERGQRVRGTVSTVTDEYVFFDLGGRAPGMLPKRQFPAEKVPHPGEVFEVVVDHVDEDEGVIAINLPQGIRKPRGNWDELQVGQLVECLVTKTNKGGLEVAVGTIRAFLPASQIDLGFVGDMEAYVGQKLQVVLTEVNPQKRNLVVSRKSILVKERKEAAKAFWEQVEVGQKYSGKVKTVKDYGVFVDLGGADGFIHVGEMSWGRIKHPSDLLKEGDEVEVVVLTVDKDKKKIGLGMRQLVRNPWEEAVERFPAGTKVRGRVTRTTEFGAFVELMPGVEGLVHVSELDYRRVRSVTDVLKTGQETELQVLEIDPERQRISLSLKALKEKPEDPRDKASATPETPAYERKRKGPLRGGRDDAPSSGGGLFGDPGSFQK